MLNKPDYMTVSTIADNLYHERGDFIPKNDSSQWYSKKWALWALGQTGVVLNYRCRPNGGDEVVGSRYTYYELIEEDGEPKAVLHSFVLPSDSGDNYPHLLEHVYPRPVSYEATEEILLAKYNPLHRSRKKVRLSELCGYFFSEEDERRSTLVGLMAARLDLLMRETIPTIVIDEITGGRNVVEAYDRFDDWCSSCMTGCDSEYVEIWGTNPKQCRLLVLREEENNETLARVLVFRPETTTLSIVDSKQLEDLPLGPGWYYGRIYPDRRLRSPNRTEQRCMGIAAAHLESIGVKSLNAQPTGIVPLRLTEYSPYIDWGRIYWCSSTEQVVWAQTIDNNPTLQRWKATVTRPREIESFTDGSGFGNSRETHTCSCCDCGYDGEEEGAYVDGYGSVCQSCLDDSDSFVIDDQGEWRTADNCHQFMSQEHASTCLSYRSAGGTYLDDNVWIVNRATSTRVIVRQTGGTWTSTRVTIIPVTFNDETVYVPQSEAVQLSNDEWAWTHDESLMTVSKRIVLKDNGRLHVEDLDEEEYTKQDECVRVDDTWVLDSTGIYWLKESGFVLTTGDRSVHVRSVAANRSGCKVCKYGNWYVLIDSDSVVVHAGISEHHRDDLPANAPKTGEYWSGRGYPIRIVSRVMPMPFVGSSTTVHQSIWANEFGRDVTVSWCHGNHDGYAVTDDSNWMRAFSLMLLNQKTFVQSHEELKVAFVNTTGAVVRRAYTSGYLSCGNLTLFLNARGLIEGGTFYLGGDMIAVDVSSFNETLRALCNAVNRGRSQATQTELINYMSNFIVDTHAYFDNPSLHVLGSSYIITDSFNGVTS
jgi:hypothetical protein